MENNNDIYKDNDTSVSKIKSFIDWLDEQKYEIRGGKKMYDVKYYKWLTEAEMYEYWLQHIYFTLPR